MLGSFRSLAGQSDEQLAGTVDGILRVLAPFPYWAIEKACTSIQINGVMRDGRYDRKWPPNDSEVVAEVRDKLRLYRDQFDSADALLNAKVAK